MARATAARSGRSPSSKSISLISSPRILASRAETGSPAEGIGEQRSAPQCAGDVNILTGEKCSVVECSGIGEVSHRPRAQQRLNAIACSQHGNNSGVLRLALVRKIIG